MTTRFHFMIRKGSEMAMSDLVFVLALALGHALARLFDWLTYGGTL